jgi:hypothetical protein
VIAAASLLAAVWFLLWFVSSASLACLACDCRYSFFAENLRCRQPPVAALLAVISFLLAIVFLVLGIWKRKRPTALTEQG